MNANTKLASVGGHTFRLRHLMTIAILVAAVSIAFMIRAQPAQYGFELNEFDPFFNYRATLYMVENGIPAYYEWHDTMSWYPEGRDISATSQVVLHMAAAVTYQMIAEGQMSLYDYTIIFPAVFGALTAVVLFALVRVIGGTSAGLFAAMLYSVSLPILVRSPIGWFKSEPFGLFLSILAAYLLVSGLYSANRGVAAARLVAAGLFVSASVSAWGGNQFFVIPIGILFLALPFLRKDHGFLVWAVPLFSISTLATSYLFERGLASTPLAGLALVTAAGFLVACIFIQKKSGMHRTRNGLIFLAAVLVVLPAGAVVGIESGIVQSPEYRYANALNPFLTTEIPLVESVSEHATTTTTQSFLFHSILMIFAGIGAWFVIKSFAESRQDKESRIRIDMFALALMIGITGTYISSSYVRLEVFASVSVIILASLGLAMLSREFVGLNKNSGLYSDEGTGHPASARKGTIDDPETARQTGESDEKRHNAARVSPPSQARQRPSSGLRGGRRRASGMLNLPYMAGIVVLLLLPLTYSGTSAVNVFTHTDMPPTILTGGAAATPTNDWPHALAWIKNSTPPDSVIAAWWDYGYWISTVGERTSLADNATIDSKRIERLADMFISTPDEAWRELKDMQADYILVFVAGQMIGSVPEPVYTLQHGGDESKKQWFMRIGGHNTNLYLHMDGISGTEYFWENTAVAHFFPFSVATYLNPADTLQQFPTYVPGTIPIYVKDVKYPADGDGPFRLAYTSPSFTAEAEGPMLGIFIYEINDNYDPVAASEPEQMPEITIQIPTPEVDGDGSEDNTQSKNDTS